MSVKFQARHLSGWWVNGPSAFHFPAGEQHLKVRDGFDPLDYSVHLADLRGYSAEDLFSVAMWADYLGDAFEGVPSFGRPKVVLALPYIPAARADRGAPFGAAVYGEFIAAIGFDQIIVLDPHSPISVEWLNGGYDAVTPLRLPGLVAKAVQGSYVGVIAPDKGAVARASSIAGELDVPLFRAEKTRDFETGKLSGYELLDELPKTGRLLVVDDIFDGGGTFGLLADAAGLPPERLDLWVSHGIFSKGFEITKRFGNVYTTNSYFNPWDDMWHLAPVGGKRVPDNIHVLDITPAIYEAAVL